MSSREAIAILLDVCQFMGLPANDQGDSHLDLACDAINWIVSRKIFTESKDEIALILFGCEETDNPLAENDQYQNISVARQLQLPDFDFIKFIQNEVRPSNIDGDFLDALVVAMEVLKDGTEGKKFGLCSITLFSNLGGTFSENQHEEIAKGLTTLGIELNIIGPDVRSVNHDDDNSQNSQDSQTDRKSSASAKMDNSQGSSRKKTEQMLRGEKVVKQLYSLGIDGECYSPAEVIPMLCRFQKRTVRPMPWKCNMQIGDRTEIPVCMYLKTKGNHPFKFRDIYIYGQIHAEGLRFFNRHE